MAESTPNDIPYSLNDPVEPFMKVLRHLTKAALRFLSRVLVAAFKLGLLFISGAIALLASAARTAPADDSLSSSVRGGELNLRTGRFDDGTDPDGFYDFE